MFQQYLHGRIVNRPRGYGQILMLSIASPGVNVTITGFGDFRQFSAEKMGFFL
jgi:hypothetical protein